MVRRFHLKRTNDVSGVSGTGERVAEGAEMSNGLVCLTFLSPYPHMNMYLNIKVLESVHGHSGDTEVVWDDEEE